MKIEIKTTKLELEFKSNAAETGEFEGYGAVYGNVDTYGDVVTAGAFAASILDHKAKGTRPAMHLNHGLAILQGVRSVGVWNDFSEDTKGLHMKGKLSGMDTDVGKMRKAQIEDGAYGGLSIGFSVPKGGAEAGLGVGGIKRRLNQLGLVEVSITDDPANTAATITAIKAANGMAETDTDKAINATVEAMRLHDRMMGTGYYDYSSSSASSITKDRAILMNHLRDVHEALTGERAPADLIAWKSQAWTMDEIKARLASKGIDNLDAVLSDAFKIGESSPPEVKSAFAGMREALNLLP